MLEKETTTYNTGDLLYQYGQSPYSQARAYLIANLGNCDYTRIYKILGKENIGVINQKKQNRKNCIECSKVGYHSKLFDLSFIYKCPIHGENLKKSCPSCGEAWILPSKSALAKKESCDTCGFKISAKQLIHQGLEVENEKYKVIEETYNFFSEGKKHFNSKLFAFSNDSGRFYGRDSDKSPPPNLNPVLTIEELHKSDFVLASYALVKGEFKPSNSICSLPKTSLRKFKIQKSKAFSFSKGQRKALHEKTIKKIKNRFFSEFNRLSGIQSNYCETKGCDSDCLACFIVGYWENKVRDSDEDSKTYTQPFTISYTNKLKEIDYGVYSDDSSYICCVYDNFTLDYDSSENINFYSVGLSSFIYENHLWQLLIMYLYRFVLEHNLYEILGKSINVIRGLNVLNCFNPEPPKIQYLVNLVEDELAVYYPTCFENKSINVEKNDEVHFFKERSKSTLEWRVEQEASEKNHQFVLDV